ncbi:hypothetical protein KKF29_02880 [Patescibacteria group bacterium]|nr:hypothetical protein [Patescibacteria group bacterium]
MLKNKKIYASQDSIHFGASKPNKKFDKSDLDTVQSALENLGKRKLWRCFVCSDLHIGNKPPAECPTCLTQNAYAEISEQEFKILIGLND